MAGGAALFIDCVDEKAVPVEWNQLIIVREDDKDVGGVVVEG